MRGKPVTSAERKIMQNVFSYFKANNAIDTEGSLIQKTAEATRYPFATVRRVLEEASQGKFGHFIPMSGMKCPNRKEALSKIDNFNLRAIRRVIHSFYSRNESPTVAKILKKKLKEDFNFPYEATTLSITIKELSFCYKRRSREYVIYERGYLIEWKENFLRRIKEIRETEPDHEIVYTDETWLNAHHRVKKEWVDVKALKNPQKSLKDYGTVGCTKE